MLRIYQFTVQMDEDNVDKFSSTLQRIEYDDAGQLLNATDKIVLLDDAGVAVQTLLNDHVAVQKLPKAVGVPVRVSQTGRHLAPGDFVGVGEPLPHLVDSNVLTGTPDVAFGGERDPRQPQMLPTKTPTPVESKPHSSAKTTSHAKDKK